MRTLIFLVLFAFCYTGRSFADDSTQVHPPFAFFIMPCQVLPIAYANGLTIGAEFRIYHRFSMTIEGGGFTTAGNMFKTNVKYYFPRVEIERNKEVAQYLAIEYAYKLQSYNVDDYLRDPPNTDVNYSVDKFATTINFKYGYVKSRRSSKHRAGFYTDLYFGAGIRYKVVRNSLIAGQESKLYHWNEGFIDNYANSAMIGYVPTLSLGVKIGYRYI